MKAENRLLDHLDISRMFLKAKGREAIDMLPLNSAFRFDEKGELQPPDCDRVEVAEHLVNMWICQIVAQHWPEYHRAKAKAAHLFSVPQSFHTTRCPDELTRRTGHYTTRH